MMQFRVLENNMIVRPFAGANDMLLMAALSNRSPEEHLRLTDLPYRLSSWALDEVDNTRLWFDSSGELISWAVMQLPFWTIDYSCSPASCADLLPIILEWANERANHLAGPPHERPCWFVMTFADRLEPIRILEAAGYACQADVGENSWSKVWMQRRADLSVKDYRIPAGFKIRPLAGEAEAAAYVNLHQRVFESKNMTEAWRRRTLHHPDYVPDLDLVVEAPDGSLAAFCIGWLNKHDDYLTGQIEPLGCHPDYRHLALGRLALAECLRRLQAHGAQHIYVETDNYRSTALRLYESMGFQVTREVLVFRKDFAATTS
jgi:mycothiol synthase